MPHFRSGTVTALLSQRVGLQRVEVDGERAYVLTDLIGEVAVGDRVVMNVTAVDLGLGTGGWHVVHWNLARDDFEQPGRGHIMKMRYTSLQADTGVAEEHHDLPATIDGTPVVVAALHSQLAPVAAAVKALDERLRLVYVMTDGGALPLALSDLVADLRRVAVLDAVVTAGHAFGGDEESINVRSALCVARHLCGADVIVVAMGPGSVGTATAAGYSGIEVGAGLDAAGDLGGVPIAALRYSEADARPRHQGVSHHSRTALRHATHVPVRVAVPAGEPDPVLGANCRFEHIVVPDVAARLHKLGVVVTSMGRTTQDDPKFFTYAAAAGALAAQIASGDG